MADIYSDDIPAILGRYLADSGTAWSLGTFGAVAEFMRDRDEPLCVGQPMEIATTRGAIRIEPCPALRLVPYETASRNGQSWHQSVAICLPENLSGMSARTTVTELGPDHGAVREQDRAAILFDLGLAIPHIDACVRTDNPEAIMRLRESRGRVLLDPSNPLMSFMPLLSPHRVFLCPFGRVEVFQPVPPPSGESPEGPHTHLLPRLLAHGRSHAATVPIPQGLVPAMHMFPPHPERDLMGKPRPIDVGAFEDFQALINHFADPEIIHVKCMVADAIRSGADPATLIRPAGRHLQMAFRVAIRQASFWRQ
ncbi:MAG: hypothetical protein PW790_08425 [Parvibaculaceae bacterium]|nr:hypothetical protein [Parvibaculaceae bacterium]